MRISAAIGCCSWLALCIAAEHSCVMQFSDMVKKYKPVAYVNGHDHAIDYSKPAGYATQFFTSGAPAAHLEGHTLL